MMMAVVLCDVKCRLGVYYFTLLELSVTLCLQIVVTLAVCLLWKHSKSSSTEKYGSVVYLFLPSITRIQSASEILSVILDQVMS